MEEEKFLGEPSNSNNKGSLLSNNNNNNISNQANSNAAANSHRPSSSTSSHKQTPSLGGGDDASYNGDGDDIGWWDCSLCTYKNSADKFKCEICDLRRGTSTRKPRCNADTIVAQVVKQQEQIRQQTRAKPPKNRLSSTGVGPTSSNESAKKSKSKSRALDGKRRRMRNGGGDDGDEDHDDSDDDNDDDDNNDDEDDEDDDDRTVREMSDIELRSDLDSDSNSNDSPKPPQKKPKQTVAPLRKIFSKTKKKKTHGNRKPRDLNNSDSTVMDIDTDTTDISEPSTPIHRSSSESSLIASPFSNSSSTASSPAITPEPTTSSPIHSAKTNENPFKITPIEVNGNLIKYTPPTSSGRTGLIIDKKRFTQHSVTVNEVTITFTEFATRQNKYIRKKKNRRDGGASRPKANNGNGKSKSITKNEPKSTANSASSTGTGDT